MPIPIDKKQRRRCEKKMRRIKEGYKNLGGEKKKKMKTRYIAIPIVMIAVLALAALSTPAMADYAFAGFEVKTITNGTVQGDVYVSNGTKAGYAPSPYISNYTVPSGTVKWARLYTGVWCGNDEATGWVNVTITDNSNTVTYRQNISYNGTNDNNPTYDENNVSIYGTGYGCIAVAYNTTADNVTSGEKNTVNATSTIFGGYLYGVVLVVVYEDSNLEKVEYWVNEGNVNLNYGPWPHSPLNYDFTYFNGIAYNCTEANLTVVYYTGDSDQNDYLFFNAPDESGSPYRSSVQWSNTSYWHYQLDDKNVADSHSDKDGVCEDNSISTSAQDLNCFSETNDSTPLEDIVNHTANNYAIFWRGHDDSGNGIIDGGWGGTTNEGEIYVHPILAVLRLENITHDYDFGSNLTGTPGTDAWAFRKENNSKPPTTCNVPNTEFSSTEYGYIKTDNGVYQTDYSVAQYAAHRFNFSIDEAAADIDKINVTWNGNGTHQTSTDGANLSIWNFTSAAYELLQAGANTEDEVTLTGGVTSSISNYINTNNVTVLVEQNTAGGGLFAKSYIKTDYVKLVVTPDP